MTAEALWAVAGLRETAHHLDLREPLFEFTGTHEPLLIEIASDRALPELPLP